MGAKENYEARTEALILPILEPLHFELVDVEYVKEGSTWYLRAFIDKEGGITVNDCEVVSRQMSDLLDQEDFIPDAYIFEVSSPGLGRQLKKDKDFVRNMGKEVEIKLYKAISLYDEKGKEVKEKEVFGILKAFDDATVTIAFDENDEPDAYLQLNRKEIAIIRLAIQF
ncbi:MAG: ribosome maturation factor RimP [Lachnospiraceae bacterium]|nr:ribosome maturation factor RimP [Lachnospiraceae bacterium]